MTTIRSKPGRRRWAIVLLALLLPGFDGCSSGRLYRGAIDSITVGSGGGFAGMYTGYIIDRAGKVAYWSGDGIAPASPVPVFELPEDTAGYYFRRLDSIGVDTIAFDHPHNLTKFVRVTVADSTYTLRWGDPRHSPPEAIVSYYRDLLETIQRQSKH